MKLVTRESATLPGYDSMALAKSHQDLVSFESCKDIMFQLIRGPIKRIVQAAPALARSRFNAIRHVDFEQFKSVMLALEGVSAKKQYESLKKRVHVSDQFWIVKEPECVSWMCTDPQSRATDCLWIRGPEGRGKSAAVLSIIDKIKGDYDASSRAFSGRSPPLLAHFFCDPTQDGSSPEELLKSLLCQLVGKQEMLAPYAQQFAAKKTGSSQETGSSISKVGLTIENLWQSLLDMLSDELVETVYIVLHNIHVLPEEHEGTKKLMSRLRGEFEVGDDSSSAGEPGGAKIRWLITSREVSSIQHALLDPVTLTRLIDLKDPKYNKQMGIELRKHVERRILALEEEKKYSRALAYFASSLIGKRAQDTNWVDVACLRLAQIPPTTRDLRVRRELEAIPQDLDRLLDSMWMKVSTFSC